MEKFLKKSNWTEILVSILFILFGILLLTRPEFVMSMISVLLGLMVIAIGVFKGIDYFASGKQDNFSLSIAIVSIILGIVIMFCADIILSIFRIVIALWIIYGSIINLQTTIVWRDYKSKLWLLTLLLAIVMLLGGIYILVNNGAMLQMIGVMIIIYGIIDILESVIFIKKIDNYLK